jgi:hypothetical protein
VVVVQPYLGAVQDVAVPQDQRHAWEPLVVTSAGEFAYAPCVQAAVPVVGSESSGVVPLEVPQESEIGAALMDNVNPLLIAVCPV